MGSGEYRAMLGSSRDNRGNAVDTITELFPNLYRYLELMPVMMMGILSGIVSYFNNTNASDSNNAYTHAIKSIVTCAFLAILTYSILSATDLPYLAKVGISCAIGYFGIDKTIELVQNIITLKGARTTDQVDKPAKK